MTRRYKSLYSTVRDCRVLFGWEHKEGGGERERGKNWRELSLLYSKEWQHTYTHTSPHALPSAKPIGFLWVGVATFIPHNSGTRNMTVNSVMIRQRGPPVR